jgi:hypothetical protein
MTVWAARGFLHQMGFFRFDEEYCCELKPGYEVQRQDKSQSKEPKNLLTNQEIVEIVTDRLEKLELGSSALNPSVAIQKTKRRSRSMSPQSRRF